jgi:hypothetical protein
MTEQLATVLQQFSPDLKVGGVLVAISILFFKIGNFFWDYEKTASKESIEKLKDVLGHFKDLYIRPILEKKTYQWLDGAYQEAISLAHNHVSAAVQKTPPRRFELDDVDSAFSDFNKANLIAQLKSNDRVSEFYSSNDGVSLLDKLDSSYLKARDYKKYYDQMISSCRNLIYFCYSLGVILFCSLLHIAFPFPQSITYFIFNSCLLIFLLGLINFIRFEVYRRKLSSIWEELLTIGNLYA